ncbi:MAG: hypothetical protein AAFX94_12685 [Myxococcota bacterium]
MPEPKKNPNSRFIVDPPGWLRLFISRQILGPFVDSAQVQKRRNQAEAKRQRRQEPHVVHYFHQLDDPYSHLIAQIIATFAERYAITLKVHLVRATGGANQPASKELGLWARRDAELIAPHHGLTFPSNAGTVPDPRHMVLAGQALANASDEEAVAALRSVSDALWTGDENALAAGAADGGSAAEVAVAVAPE